MTFYQVFYSPLIRGVSFFKEKLLYLYVMSDKKVKKQVERKVFERVITHEDSIQIWKYDNYKSNTGPYEVEIKYPKKKG